MIGRAGRRWATTVALAGLLAGCTVGPSHRPDLVVSQQVAPVAQGSTASSSAPVGPGGPGQTAPPISWGPCDSEYPSSDGASGRSFVLDCATFRVPRSYPAQQGGTTIPVTVARARGQRMSPDAPTLVAVLGEPGDNGSARVAAVAGRLPTAITDHFAVIVPDLRGTAGSFGVSCVDRTTLTDLLAPPADPSTTEGVDVESRTSRALTFNCTDEVGPDLSRFATEPAADDLDTLRAAVGAGRLNFLGQGYGATLGAVYAHRYPGRAGAMVLDGPSDPLQAVDKAAVDQAAAAEKAFGEFAAACPSFTGGCPLGSDPRAAVTSLISDLGDSGQTSAGQLLSGGSVLLVLSALLGDPDRWPELAVALADARQKNLDKLAELVLQVSGGDDRRQVLSGRIMYACNDTAVRLGGDRLTAAARAAKAASPLFGPFLVGRVGRCADWPAPQTPLGAVSAAGAPPMLVLGAVDDPVSSYAGVRSLAGQLTSAVLVSWQSGTHGAYPASACVTDLVDSYLLAGRNPAVGTLCPP